MCPVGIEYLRRFTSAAKVIWAETSCIAKFNATGSGIKGRREQLVSIGKILTAIIDAEPAMSAANKKTSQKLDSDSFSKL